MPDFLPDDIKVKHYALSLRDLNFAEWTYQGTVVLRTEVVKATKEIVLNSIELQLFKAKIEITGSGRSWESTKFEYDVKAQRVTISLDQEIPASKEANITITFSGCINDKMAGFYRSRYKPVGTPAPDTPRDKDWCYQLSTQFQSVDARRAFPCFDQPNIKTTFDLEIEIPNGQVALGNMPVKSSTPSKEGWKLVSFETSLPMSSYLLAWAIGDFEYIEAFTKDRIPVRVYTTRGLKQQGQWALENGPKMLEFHTDTFGIKYPLPKLDLLAVHEFSSGAMENWGLVVYRITAILYDEETSDISSKNDIAYTIAHELAHQWFGNLVTMNWWDELWLNEAFATWAGWSAVDHAYPDWNVWPQFINEGMEDGFHLDSIRASHPVYVDVEHGHDADSVFDAISYLKGCSFIRMIADYVSPDVFITGVSSYLRDHQYGNATSQDLWRAVEEASGQPISHITDAWVMKVGHPVLSISEPGSGRLSMRQTRFLSTGDVHPKDDTTVWQIPITLKNGEAVKRLTLGEKEDVFLGIDDDFYFVNGDSTGFFRVYYPSSRFTTLASQLFLLSPEDRIALVASTASVAFAGTLSTPALLELVLHFKDEGHAFVWSQVMNSMQSIQSVFGEDEEIRGGLQRFVAGLIDDQMGDEIWDFQPDDTYLQKVFRKTLITGAVAFGHPRTVATAVRKFNAWVEDPVGNPIHPSLRAAVWRAGLANDPVKGVRFLKQEWRETTSVDGQVLCLQALSTLEREDLLMDDILPFLFEMSPPDERVPAADMAVLGSGLADNHVARPMQWAYMQENWDTEVAVKLSNALLLERFIEQTLDHFSEESEIAVIESFFARPTMAGFERTLNKVKDKIRARAYYKRRDEEALREWLNNHVDA